MALRIHKNSLFTRFTKEVAHLSGHPVTSLLALLIIVVWAISGPIFGFSDTWQLVINTGTTIITFLMVFLIQNTQNRDSMALQLKLDELLRATEEAQNSMMDLEELEEKELEVILKKYRALAARERKKLRSDQSEFDIFGKKGDGDPTN
ncbi:MAG: low affinity iron permease family protein [Proteobacteria bacterium]|nr:MAG: low affinity iron permease family protein [Pseudomonadota bacterium]